MNLIRWSRVKLVYRLVCPRSDKRKNRCCHSQDSESRPSNDIREVGWGEVGSCQWPKISVRIKAPGEEEESIQVGDDMTSEGCSWTKCEEQEREQQGVGL